MPRLSAVVTHEALKDELEAYDVDLTDYEGPTRYSHTSWQPVVPRALRGLVSGEVPQVTQGSYPRLTQAMLVFLSQLWRLPLDLEEIEEQAIELEATLHEQIDTNPELADYIRRLEQVYDQAEGPQPDMNTDAIVDEIQQFLRRRRDNPLGNDL